MSTDAIPLDGSAAPVFSEPWEAQAFALVVALHDRGLFDWSEWADALGAHTRQTGRAADYAAWLATLEGLLAARRSFWRTIPWRPPFRDELRGVAVPQPFSEPRDLRPRRSRIHDDNVGPEALNREW
jgi:nitrile hydratase accessory protein